MRTNRFKKAIGLTLACSMLLGLLTACGGNSSNDNSGTDTSTSPTSASSGDTLKLSFSHHDAATSAWGIFFEEWADNIGEASGGAVDITVYPGASLAAPADGLQALRTGVCDFCGPIWPSSPASSP